MARKRKSSNDDWLEDLIKLGLGAIALSLLSRALQGNQVPEISNCPYCGQEIHKWSRSCPRCRTPFNF